MSLDLFRLIKRNMCLQMLLCSHMHTSMFCIVQCTIAGCSTPIHYVKSIPLQAVIKYKLAQQSDSLFMELRGIFIIMIAMFFLESIANKFSVASRLITHFNKLLLHTCTAIKLVNREIKVHNGSYQLIKSRPTIMQASLFISSGLKLVVEHIEGCSDMLPLFLSCQSVKNMVHG